MPFDPLDIVLRLTGGATNTNPNASLGGAKSASVMVGDVKALFDDVSKPESTSGDIEYRCVDAHNDSDLTLENAVAWLGENTASDSTVIAIGVGTSAVNGTEQAIANENTAPVGVVFTSPSTSAAGISLGNIPPGGHRALWVRRTVAEGAAGADNDRAVILIRGGYTE